MFNEIIKQQQESIQSTQTIVSNQLDDFKITLKQNIYNTIDSKIRPLMENINTRIDNVESYNNNNINNIQQRARPTVSNPKSKDKPLL